VLFYKFLPYISFEKYIKIFALEMASPSPLPRIDPSYSPGGANGSLSWRVLTVSKSHLDRLRRFGRAHGRDQHTDRQRGA